MRERGQELILAPVRLHEGRGIGLELVALSSDLVALLIKLKEHTGLAAQNVRLDRLVKEVHRASFVSPESALTIGSSRSEKDDRRPAGSLGSPHELGELVAVHFGHLHIENGERDIVFQEQLQRLGSRARLEQHKPVAPQEALKRQQVFLKVVNEQKINGSDLGRHRAPTSRRYAAISFTGRTRASGQAAMAASGIATAEALPGFCTTA